MQGSQVNSSSGALQSQQPKPAASEPYVLSHIYVELEELPVFHSLSDFLEYNIKRPIKLGSFIGFAQESRNTGDSNNAVASDTKAFGLAGQQSNNNTPQSGPGAPSKSETSIHFNRKRAICLNKLVLTLNVKRFKKNFDVPRTIHSTSVLGRRLKMHPLKNPNATAVEDAAVDKSVTGVYLTPRTLMRESRKMSPPKVSYSSIHTGSCPKRK